MWDSFTDETKWCLHYAIMHGVNIHFLPHVFEFACDEPKKTYTLIENKDTSRFMSLAKRLREIWPKGVRVVNGKEYPWRDTSRNLAKRLEVLFKIRELDKYTDDDVLSAARRYVSRFEDDKTYMKGVSYFILKRDSKDGMNQLKSILADMLEHIYDDNSFMDMIEDIEGGEVI